MANAVWIVAPEDDGAAVEVIAARIERSGDPVAEGRVFVGGRRAAAGLVLRAGDRVELWRSRGATARAGAPASPRTRIEVAARDGEVLFAVKPADLATEPERRGGDALVTRLAADLGGRRVHAASRLDAGVSGLVACATGPRGAARLAAAKEHGQLRRVYVAIASGVITGTGLWEGDVEGKPASTRWRARAAARGATWLELELITGRTHQIRVHAAAAGAPLLGDAAHGGPRRIATTRGSMIELRRPMLHAAAAALLDRGARPALAAVLPPPDDLRSTWLALDGDPAAWEGWLPPWSSPG